MKTEFETRRPRLGVLLANASILEIDGAKLVLGFADRADADATEKARADIEQALGAELGSPVRVVARHDPATAHAPPPVVRAEVADEADALAADKVKREREARQHPLIVKAQDLFGVGIREIKT